MGTFSKDQILQLFEGEKVVADVTVVSVVKEIMTIKNNKNSEISKFLFKEEAGHWYVIFDDPFQSGVKCIDYNFPYDFKII